MYNQRFLNKFTCLPISLAVSTLLLTACSSNQSMSKSKASTTSIPKSDAIIEPTVERVPVFVPTVKKPQITNNQKNVDFGDSLLDEDSLDELEYLLEAQDMTMVESNQADILRFGNVWDRLRKGYMLEHNQAYNGRVEAQKKWFVTRQEYLNRLTARASRYLYHTVREAERRNIPTELALLPVIESSFDPSATSNANAAGLWQFIPSTGRIYGLSISGGYDGRRDIIESTRAAYDFLTALYNQFGSWELALAAYNAGPGRIQNAIDRNLAKGLPTDFWSLRLPKETMNYVPRFMAVTDIVANPSQYGVYFPAIANKQHFRSVPVKVGVNLYEVARASGVAYDELQKLNPGMLSGRVEAYTPQRVVIPNALNINVESKIKKLGANFSTNTNTFANNTNIRKAKTFVPATSAKSRYDVASAAKYVPKTFQAASGALPTSPDALADYANHANVPLPKQTSRYIPPNSSVNSNQLGNQANTKALATKSTKSFVDSLPQPVVVKSSQANTVKPNTVNPSAVNNVGQNSNLPTSYAAVTKNNTIVQEPPLSSEERAIIAKQIQAEMQQKMSVVSEVDGNIKLSALQTQQSVLQAQGKGKTMSFATANNTYGKQKRQPSNNVVNAVKARPKGVRSTYRVQRGDTLSNIAQRAGVSWQDIAKWNQIDPKSKLLWGSTLYLYNAKSMKPLKVATNKVKSTDRPKTYTVQAGNTLIGTAVKFDLSVSELARYNNLSTGSELKVGQKLWLVPNQVKTTTKAVKKVTNSVRTKNYKVQSGETLIGLARGFNISTDVLANLNNISSNTRLRSGQIIKVPYAATRKRLPAANTATSTAKPQTTQPKKPTVNTVKYRIRSGDTLIGISRKLGMSADKVASVNNFTSKYQVKRGEIISLPASQKMVDLKVKQQSVRYKVTTGDTLIGVASRYGISVSRLATANGLTSKSQLRRGSVITIPANGTVIKTKPTSTSKTTKSESTKVTTSTKPVVSSRNTFTHKVKPGETLIGIARKYGTSTSKIAQLNGFSSKTRVTIGKNLVIPKQYVKYKVKSGDTLIGLARKYAMTTTELAKLNGFATNTKVRRGQWIKVPNR